jgi:2'-hydroxyisoflavone reductase
MTTTRRDLLKWITALSVVPGALAAAPPVARAPRSLDMLFLGGTGFIGRHQVEYALARGHRVTLFNRGKSAPGLFSNRAEILLGNRDTNIAPGLSALQGDRRWDVVIDNSGYVPRHVRDSVALLQGRTQRYVYVSTVAVYEPQGARALDEKAALHPAPATATEEVTGATYGPLKAESDRVVQAALGNKATIVRPTYIIGPGDETDRFTYWIERIARGGEVLGPPEPQSELQVVDARDLCPWIVNLAERDQAGIFNAAGPAAPVTWEQTLRELARLAPQPVKFRWATRDVLEKTGIQLPMVRSAGGASVHFDSTAAQAAGLAFRPLADTAADTLEWWRAQSDERRAEATRWPTPAQEQEALNLLAAQTQ